MTILSLAPLRRMPLAPAHDALDAGDAAACLALAEVAGAPGQAPDSVRACGWFDSSWELRQGLAVSELPETELPVAALWFADLLPMLPPAPALALESAWLQ